MIVDKLIDKIIAMQNPTCVGLDTSVGYLPPELMAEVKDARTAAKAVLEFNQGIIDAVADIVPAVKVQIAYYEELGAYGMKAFAETEKYARRKGLIVIADAKRGDIGTTAACYARAFLGKTEIAGKKKAAFQSDFVTVNGYLGTDGVLPFVEECKAHDRGMFVLVKTSNASSGELQDMPLADGRTVYECMGDMVGGWGHGTRGRHGYGRVGAVVGATYPAQAERLRARLPETFFLVPGYGAQGANAEMLKNCFHAGGMGGIVNNSRGILLAYRKTGGTYSAAARAAAAAMQKDLVSVLGEIHDRK